MKINRRGEVCYGSLTGLFVNETKLDGRHATDACWLDDDVIAAQVEVSPGVWQVLTCHVPSGKLTVALEHGASHVRAGGGTLATWTLAGGVEVIDVAPAWSRAGLCDVSPEGRIVTTPTYQVGEGLNIYDADGAVIRSVPTGPLGSASGTGYNVRLRGDTLLYQDRSGWHLDAGIVPRTEPIALAVPVPLPNGRVALIELSERLTIRYADRSVGYVITENDTWFPDARMISDSLIEIAWSKTPLEVPQTLERAYVTATELNSATYDLNAVEPPPPPPPPPPPIDPPKEPPVTPIFSWSTAEIVKTPDIRGWAETTAITKVDVSDDVRLTFEAKGRWPAQPWGKPGDNLQYSVGIFTPIDGKWVGSAPIQCWKDRDGGSGNISDMNADGSGKSQIAKNWFYDDSWGVLHQQAFRPGTRLGLFVMAGNGRGFEGPTSVHERSNVVFFDLPAGPATFTFADNGHEPPPPPPPDPPKEPPPPTSGVTLNEIAARLDIITQALMLSVPDVRHRLDALGDASALVLQKLDALSAAVAQIKVGAAPVYEGTIKVLGQSVKLTLTPKA